MEKSGLNLSIPKDTTEKVQYKRSEHFPDWIFKYVWELGKSKYGKLYDGNSLPPNTKITLTGEVYTDSVNKILFRTTNYNYKKPTKVECLTDPDWGSSQECLTFIRINYDEVTDVYGNPIGDEKMKKDYYNCKNN